MGMLNGKVVGEVMAIQIAEIGAQGAERTFTIVSKDDAGSVSICRGSYGYAHDDGIVEGDVRNTDLEKALPVIRETGIAQLYSMVRGHFSSRDGKWFHIDTGYGNHFLVASIIAKDFLVRFRGQSAYAVYERGIEVVKEMLS